MTDTVAAVVAFGSVYYVVPRIAGVGPTLHCCAAGERGDAQCSLGGGERILRARVESTPRRRDRRRDRLETQIFARQSRAVTRRGGRPRHHENRACRQPQHVSSGAPGLHPTRWTGVSRPEDEKADLIT